MSEITEKIIKEAKDKTNEWANDNINNDISYSEGQYWKMYSEEIIAETKKKVMEIIVNSNYDQPAYDLLLELKQKLEAM